MHLIRPLAVFTWLLTILTAGVWAQSQKAAAFSDTFGGGTLDAAKWIASGGKAPGTKGQHAGFFSPTNLDFSQGMLRIKLTQERKPNGDIVSKGGEIQSKEKFGYGIYEFTMRMGSTSETPDGAGSVISGGVSAGFSYINNSQTEIDIEAIGSESKKIHLTTWVNQNPDKNPTVKQSDEFQIADPGEQFHTYGYAWYPGHVEYYIDGKLMAVHKKNVPTSPAYIVINHWGNNAFWGGTATPNIVRYMYVKSVRFVPYSGAH